MPSGTPAPGYRNYASGTLYLVGFSGYSWSSSVSGSTARFVNFNNGEIILQLAYSRTRGLQVRCLQE